MKIRFWDRLILFLGALMVVVTGGALFVAGLQFQGVFAENMPLWLRVICIVWGSLLVVFGGYVVLFPRRFSAKRHEFVVQRTDNGELRIAVKAIEDLVLKCVNLHEEIQLNSMKIQNGREGVVVDLNVSLANNISIPLAIASLQKQIKEYLAASSGIEVLEVRVSVESTQDQPELFENQEEKAPAEEKKVPLHERLFGRQDQPAIVPEPPKPENKEEEAAAASDPEAVWKPQQPYIIQDAPEVKEDTEAFPSEEPSAEAEEEAPAPEEETPAPQEEDFAFPMQEAPSEEETKGEEESHE